MQKKILLSIIGFLMLLLAGCDTFNTESKVTYASYTTSGTTLEDKLIKITVTLGNSVYIDRIDEVNATVNGAPKKLKFVNAKINDTNKVVNVYALQSTTVSDPITIKETNTIVINSIKCTDENDNSISISGLELMGTISLSSSSSSGTTTALTAVSGLTAEIKTVSTGYAVKLSWTASTSAKTGGYRVYVTETDGKFNADNEQPIDFTLPGTGITTSLTYFTHTGLKEGKTYFYRVTAYDGTDETPKQDVPVGKEISATSATTTTVTVPKVTGLTIEPDVDSVLLEWEGATQSSTGTEIIGYNIYASSTVAGEYKKLSTVAIDGVTTVAKTPNAIKLTRFKIGSGSIFKIDPTDSAEIGLTISSANPLYIKVAAIELGGVEGEKSSSVYSTMYDSNVPILQSSTEMKLVPYGNTTNLSDAKLGAKIEWENKTATWGASNTESVAKYIIERTNDLSKAFSAITTVTKSSTTKTSYIDGSFMELKNKKAYYRIRCVSSTGAIGRPSGYLTVEDFESLVAPVITTNDKMLVLTGITSVGLIDTYTFDYITQNSSGVKTGSAIAAVPADDFAGYKVYMSNSFDGEYILAGKVGELWGATVTVENTAQNIKIDKTKPIYVRISSYDYFGNESGLSLRTSNLN